MSDGYNDDYAEAQAEPTAVNTDALAEVQRRIQEQVELLTTHRNAFNTAKDAAASVRAQGDDELAEARQLAAQEVQEVKDRTAAEVQEVKDRTAAANAEANAALAEAQSAFVTQFDAAVDSNWVSPVVLASFGIERPSAPKGRKPKA